MGTKKLYDAVIKNGSYEVNGETKNRYVNCGAILESEFGPYLMLDRTINYGAFPNPDDRGTLLISLFKPKDKDAQPYQAPKDDSEVPF